MQEKYETFDLSETKYYNFTEVICMKLFQNEPVVQKITAALFVPAGSGAPVHTNRSAHGLAYNVDHTTTYRFSDGQVLVCSPGQCVYLPRGCSYTVDRVEPSPEPDAGVHAINFLLEAPLSDKPFLLTVRSKAVLSFFSHAENSWRQKRPGCRELCLSQLYAIFAALAQQQEEYSPLSRRETVLAPAISYIDENFTTREITVPELSRLCGVSQPYLRRLFHSAFGMPPARYIRHKRLLYARELLQTGEYSVAQAAAAAGFNDTAYFSREYRKFVGHSPSQSVFVACAENKNMV